MLHDDCRRHGPRAVWDAGVVALGYPPTWADTWGEVVAIRQALSGG